MKWTIVKHANPFHYETHWEDDPRLGVNIVHSAHSSYTGVHVGIKEAYDSKEEAQADCHKMIEANPIAGYAVCPILEGSDK